MKSDSHFSSLIIGAGISGLSAAFFCKKAGQTVRILEEESRAGGVIRSESKKSFLLEFGPNTVTPNSELMELIEDLQLTPRMILANAKAKRFIQYGGKLFSVPMSPFTFFTSNLLSAKGKIRLLSEPFTPKRKSTQDESLMDFARRRLGQEAATRLLAPFVSGVWAGDPHQLSAEGAFPKLVKWERNSGSLFKGMLDQRGHNSGKKPPKGLLSFDDGIQVLTKALSHHLKNELALNTRVDRIILDQYNRHWLVETPSGSFRANRIIFSSPTWDTARLIHPLAPQAAKALHEIPYAPLVVLHLGTARSDVGHKLDGFGYLIAPSENLETLGCLWNSSLFPNRAPEDSALLTVFLGGARHPHILELSDQELFHKATESISPILKLKKNPTLLSLTRFEKSIPQYTLEHSKRVEVLRHTELTLRGLKFAGNYMEGISVGDVVKFAKSVALSPLPLT